MKTGWKNPDTYNRCERKIRYSSFKKATLMAEKASIKTGDLIISYECFDCLGFHIGHADESQKIARINHENKPCLGCHEHISQSRYLAMNLKGWNPSGVLYCSRLCKLTAKRERYRLRKESEAAQ